MLTFVNTIRKGQRFSQTRCPILCQCPHATEITPSSPFPTSKTSNTIYPELSQLWQQDFPPGFMSWLRRVKVALCVRAAGRSFNTVIIYVMQCLSSPTFLILFHLANNPLPFLVFITKYLWREKLKSLICFKFLICEFKLISHSLHEFIKEMKIN